MGSKITMSKLAEICKIVRKEVLESTYYAKSGHPTTCLSSVELLVVLFFKYLVFEPECYPQVYHDEFILSKGHAAPLLYSIYRKVGIIKEDLMSLRKLGSPLEGHPSVRLNGVKYATGSLGQGLAIAVGAAWARKYLKIPSKVFVLMGDGEFFEGSNFEALNLATKYELNNLCLILDVNRLGQSGETMFKHNLEEYSKRISSCGWDYVIIDGHNLEEIQQAYEKFINGSEKPFAIIAKTYKGKGVSFLEDKENWHGKPLQSTEELSKAICELDVPSTHPDIEIHYAKYSHSNSISTTVEGWDIEVEDKPMATRQAISTALAKIGRYINNLIVLDADVKNSTYTEYFEKLYPERFIQCHIAEQAMTGMALGIAKNGFVVYLSTFGAFFTRAFDFIRMMVYSKPPLVIFVGTHAGVSIGEDGPSQMALEDLAMFSSLVESTVIYPSDSISAQKLLVEVFKLHLEGKLNGIVYFRVSRPSTPKIYSVEDLFQIGKVKVIKQSDKDTVAILSSGVPIFEALKAYELLRNEGINTRIIDVYSIKPLDGNYLEEVLRGVSKILVVEEHSIYGGIGQTIASLLMKIGKKVDYFDILGIDKIPISASPQDLLEYHGIDHKSIYRKVKGIL